MADGLKPMPNPWTFHGSVLWLGAIGLVIYGLGMLLGYVGKWIGI